QGADVATVVRDPVVDLRQNQLDVVSPQDGKCPPLLWLVVVWTAVLDELKSSCLARSASIVRCGSRTRTSRKALRRSCRPAGVMLSIRPVPGTEAVDGTVWADRRPVGSPLPLFPLFPSFPFMTH